VVGSLRLTGAARAVIRRERKVPADRSACSSEGKRANHPPNTRSAYGTPGLGRRRNLLSPNEFEIPGVEFGGAQLGGHTPNLCVSKVSEPLHLLLEVPGVG